MAHRVEQELAVIADLRVGDPAELPQHLRSEPALGPHRRSHDGGEAHEEREERLAAAESSVHSVRARS